MTSGMMTPTESVVIANIMNIKKVSHLMTVRFFSPCPIFLHRVSSERVVPGRDSHTARSCAASVVEYEINARGSAKSTSSFAQCPLSSHGIARA